MLRTKKELIRIAALPPLRMRIAAWSPGDGVTRYRFYPTEASESASEITCVCGLGAAWAVMQGMRGAYRLTQDRQTQVSQDLKTATLAVRTLLNDFGKGKLLGPAAWEMLQRLEPLLRKQCGYAPLPNTMEEDV